MELPWPEMTIQEKIGYGSYGTVYRVLWKEAAYALKIIEVPRGEQEARELLQELGSRENVGEYCRQAARDLLSEMRILQKLQNNSHIVSVADYRLEDIFVNHDVPGIRVCILMELLEPFTEYEISHELTEKDVVRLGLDLCDALAACEKEGIIHRDLKPENILVAEDGSFQLCDFGVARNLEKTHTASMLKGTFSYMAPEVYHGKKYDNRADIYSLGMILYRMLNQGREPFVSPQQRMVGYREKEEALNRRMNGEALPDPPGAAPELAQILQKACAFYPEKRYAGAEQLKADLLRIQKGTYQKRKRSRTRYGRRTWKDYLKTGVLGTAGALVIAFSARLADGLYQARFADYCDQQIKKMIEEEYGITSRARLSGTGVLYVFSEEDLLCTRGTEKYPWMNQKDRIKRIVFGSEVNGLHIYAGGTDIKNADSKVISEDIFRNCQNLREIDITGSSFANTMDFPFLGDSALETINCPVECHVSCYEQLFRENPWLSQEGYRMVGDTLYRYNGSREVIDDIPEGTVSIGEGAFTGHEEIRQVHLPEGIETIGNDAFSECINLAYIRLPEALKSIAGGAFWGCVSLEELAVPAGMTGGLRAGTFNGCSNLMHLTVAENNPSYRMETGVLYNADKSEVIWATPAVEGCLALPESVRGIGDYAFAECGALEELIIPESVTQIGMNLFGENQALVRLVLPETNIPYKMNGPFLCSRDGSELFFCLRNAAGRVVVPDEVMVIHDYAFASCRGMTDIVLPDTLQYIMSYAFLNCSGLTGITLPQSVRFIASYVFEGCSSLKDLVYEGTRAEWETMTERFQLGLDQEGTVIHTG